MTEVTVDHLNAVRSELQARLAEHKAEVNVTMRELTTEVRNGRREQELRDRETQEALRTLTVAVAQMESGADREEWMNDLQARIAKRTAGGLTLLAALAGTAMALIDKVG